MSSTYKICLKLIHSYKMLSKDLNSLSEKFDVFFLAGRITDDEYKQLINMITKENDENE